MPNDSGSRLKKFNSVDNLRDPSRSTPLPEELTQQVGQFQRELIVGERAPNLRRVASTSDLGREDVNGHLPWMNEQVPLLKEQLDERLKKDKQDFENTKQNIKKLDKQIEQDAKEANQVVEKFYESKGKIMPFLIEMDNIAKDEQQVINVHRCVLNDNWEVFRDLYQAGIADQELDPDQAILLAGLQVFDARKTLLKAETHHCILFRNKLEAIQLLLDEEKNIYDTQQKIYEKRFQLLKDTQHKLTTQQRMLRLGAIKLAKKTEHGGKSKPNKGEALRAKLEKGWQDYHRRVKEFKEMKEKYNTELKDFCISILLHKKDQEMKNENYYRNSRKHQNIQNKLRYNEMQQRQFSDSGYPTTTGEPRQLLLQSLFNTLELLIRGDRV